MNNSVIPCKRGASCNWPACVQDCDGRPGVPPDLLTIAKAADEEISAIHAALGAPGDYGYASREGKALYSLYKFQVELRSAIRQSEADPDFDD